MRVDRLIDVGERLRLDALAGIDHQDRALARGERPADFVGEIHVAGRVHQVKDIVLAVPRLVVQPDGLRLDRDAALALDIHGIEHLVAEVALIHAAGQLDQPIGQRRLAMVDMGDDREVADMRKVSHRPGWRRSWSRSWGERPKSAVNIGGRAPRCNRRNAPPAKGYSARCLAAEAPVKKMVTALATARSISASDGDVSTRCSSSLIWAWPRTSPKNCSAARCGSGRFNAPLGDQPCQIGRERPGGARRAVFVEGATQLGGARRLGHHQPVQRQGRVLAGQEAQEPLGDRRQHLFGRAAGQIAAVEQRDDALTSGRHDRAEQRVLVLEMAVNRGLGDIGAARDGVHAGRAVALFQEFMRGGVDDGVALGKADDAGGTADLRGKDAGFLHAGDGGGTAIFLGRPCAVQCNEVYMN